MQKFIIKLFHNTSISVKKLALKLDELKESKFKKGSTNNIISSEITEDDLEDTGLRRSSLKNLNSKTNLTIESSIKNIKANNSKKQIVAALDIGTGFVKVLIGELDGPDIKIIGRGKQAQKLSDMHEGAIADISGVIESCEKALSEAEEMAGVTAERAVLGIAGELVRGITHTITYKRSDPEKLITPDEVEMVIEKAQEKSLQKAKNQLSGESGQENLEVRIVNSAIINMSVDGYKVSNPIDFQGSSLTIQLYSAFSPIVHLGALERVAHALNLELIAVAAEPFAVSRTVLGNDPSSALSAFLIDIGAGTTDIAWVDEGGVQATRSFGIGGRTFTKSISDELDIPMEKAELAKLKIGGSDLSGPQKIKVIKALNQTLETWLSGVEICLEEFLQTANKSKGEVSLPNKIMLCGGGASLKMLIKEISETNWYEDINLMNKPKVWLIEPDTAPGFTDETGKVGDHTNITAMGLLRVAIDTLGEEIHAESKLKEGFKRLLKN